MDRRTEAKALVSCDEGTLTQSSAIQALEIAIGDVSLESNIPFMFLFPNDFVCRSIIKGNFSYFYNFSAKNSIPKELSSEKTSFYI